MLTMQKDSGPKWQRNPSTESGAGKYESSVVLFLLIVLYTL